MTKLVTTYAGATGLLIDQPDIKEAFYPHPFTHYITIQNGAKQPAKAYTYWQEVIAMIKPMLDANHIAILHLGGKEDPQLQGVHDLRGRTGWLQTNYLIKRSLCHMGNDSYCAHNAGWQHRPLVALYGSTDPGPHGPYWSDVANTVLLTSHRCGGKPTFAMQEVPKSIDFIPPEQVANAVLRLLGIADRFTHQTLFIGPLYTHAVLELIPNSVPAPTFCPEVQMTVRMDYHFSEQHLYSVFATGRKVHVVTNRALDPNLLAQFRAQVLTYAHEIIPGVDEPPIAYVDAVRALFPTNHAFYTKERDERKVADLRLTYLDHAVINTQRENTKDDFLAAALVYLNRPDTPENRLDITTQLAQNRVVVKTNRYILSNGACHLSHAHLAAGKAITSMAANTTEVIDDPAFWRDAQHYLFYSRPL